MGADAAASLHGRRVIVTRSAEDNRSLTARLTALGAEVIEMPLIEVGPPADGGAALAAGLERLTDYRWVVLTSVNGVRAVAAALGSRAWPDGVTVAPVGPVTSAAAEAAGMPVAATPVDATAESLVAAFPTWDGSGGNRVLAPLAELAGSTVVDGLGERGWSVDRVNAYRTTAPGEVGCQAPPAADAVAFFSPSVVDRFVDRYGAAAVPPLVVCIGPSTAERAAGHGLAGVTTADPHTEDGVVAELVAGCGSSPG